MATASDALAVLDREHAQLCAKTRGRELLVGLRPFFSTLQGVPRLQEHLAELRAEGRAKLKEVEQHDDMMIGKLKALRSRIEYEPARDRNDGGASLLERTGLDAFDECASHREPAALPGCEDRTDHTVTGRLLLMLRTRLDLAVDPTELVDDRARLQREHEHFFRSWTLDIQAHPGVALLRIDLVMRQLNPGPENDLGERWVAENLTEIIAPPQHLRSAVHGGLGTDEDKYVDAGDHRLRTLLVLVVDELRRRLASARSRLALLNRYAARCEWFGTEEIDALLERIADLRGKEDRLSEHLAAFLFDHDLPTLTRPIVARLEPDLFATLPFQPAFYVEAKQFEDRDGATRAVRDGARQVWNTADRISKHFELREAFLVIFRRGGPSLRFAGSAQRSSFTLHPVQVDLAPSRESGSRAPDVVEVSIDQLLAKDERA